MPRRRRKDSAGEWFHVMNRALARRTMFESGADVGVFLEALARVVRRGSLEVHALSAMATHFHALVRSPQAELSQAMHDLQLGYVRYFNRSRRRDGPLLRGRFQARFVDSLAYRRLLVGYIDANPVLARLVASPAEHTHGSCRYFVLGGEPGWLERGWVEDEVRGALGLTTYDGARYFDVFGRCDPRATAALVARRLQRPGLRDDPVDSLLVGSGPAVLEWVRRKAQLADGTDPGLPVATPASVARALCRGDRGIAAQVLPGTRTTTWREAGRAWLLRELAGATFAEIGLAAGAGPQQGLRLVARACTAIRRDADFAGWLAGMAAAALANTFAPMAAQAAR